MVGCDDESLLQVEVHEISKFRARNKISDHHVRDSNTGHTVTLLNTPALHGDY